MKLNRRGFLKGVSFAAAPLVLPGCTALTFSSNEKIRVAVIGLGRIATSFEIPCVLARPDAARIVAVCDLDSRRVDLAKSNIEKSYREKGLAGYTVDTYSDYKAVCARKDVDESRIWGSVRYDGAPWVKDASRPFDITSGLDGRHIALWQRHGRYYYADSDFWKWQRPLL